jgi:NAD(P)H-flavin reductase/ferredoxin
VSPRVRFEPIGEEIDCTSEETVLDAAFRHGYNLVYGCREGQCSACKCFLVEGEVALKPHSSFALSESEQRSGYSLMCRAMPESDLVVELLHYDQEGYRLAFPIRDGSATVEALEPLTRDIVRVVLRVDEPADFAFVPGQYVDLHVPGEDTARRSFSLAGPPNSSHPPKIELMIKRYPGGRISGMLDGGIGPGTQLGFTGPYGALRVRESERPILMIAAGSGMAPIVSMLGQLAADGCPRPVRFFYGARTEEDLFGLEEIEELRSRLPDFRFVTVLSKDGRYVQDAVDDYLAGAEITDPDAYLCGPPAMVEAAEAMLIGQHKVDAQRIFVDKFTVSADAAQATPAPDAGRGERADTDDSGRQFEWYRPQKRRATLYEDVTVDTQPSIHRHLTRGWPVHFEDGRGTWNAASTALKSSDWFAFRDPGEQWERPFYQRGAAVEVEIEGAIRSAIEEGLIADFSSEWTQFLRDFLQGPAFVEHGLWFAMATVARDCLSDSVATCVCLQAAMKQRSAQAIVLYAMDLEEQLGDFSTEAAKESFLTEEAWQPTRRYVERLAATPDWGEVIVAANLCFEPILGTLIRRELGTRAAAASGDTVTTVLSHAATQEWEWVRAWSTELCRFLLDDEAHGAANRAQINAWVEDWMPQALGAALALAPFAARVPPGIDITGAIGRVRAYADAMLEEAGLGESAGGGGGVHAASVASSPGGELAARAAPAVPGPAGTFAARRTPKGAQRPGFAPPSGPTPTAPDGSYDYVGIVMAKSAEGDAVADVLRRRDDVEVIGQPAFWDIRAKDRLVIPYHEVSEQLGYEIDAYSIQNEMSTHYGRMVAGDDALMLFSDPTEAMGYLMS